MLAVDQFSQTLRDAAGHNLRVPIILLVQVIYFFVADFLSRADISSRFFLARK